MTYCSKRRPLIFSAILTATVALGLGGLSAAAIDQGRTVSQKGRQFSPSVLSLSKGEAITVVNDDGDLLHHVYIESDNFNFDSGDQEPGSRTPIAFIQAGDFKVLCGIHPKMKLLVHVE